MATRRYVNELREKDGLSLIELGRHVETLKKTTRDCKSKPLDKATASSVVFHALIISIYIRLYTGYFGGTRLPKAMLGKVTRAMTKGFNAIMNYQDPGNPIVERLKETISRLKNDRGIDLLPNR